MTTALTRQLVKREDLAAVAVRLEEVERIPTGPDTIAPMISSLAILGEIQP